MSSSTNPGQAQPQQMQGTNIVSQEGLPTPESSAPPDDRRNEAENQRLQAQAQEAQPQQAQFQQPQFQQAQFQQAQPQQPQFQQAQPQQAQFQQDQPQQAQFQQDQPQQAHFQQAQPQQAQTQQLQGANNIAAQGGLPTQPSNDNTPMLTAEEEEAILSDVFNKAQGPLKQAYDDPFAFDWEQLEKWNDELKDRNIEGVFFDKTTFMDTFTEARLLRDQMQNADETTYRVLYDKWGELTERYKIDLNEYNFPVEWSLPEQEPPPPLNKILAHREMRNGNEYYVENMNGDKTYCEVKTEAQLGPSVVKTYLSSDNKVSVTEHSMKYRKKDFERFGGVLHVACKPVHTRIVKDDGRKPRRPPTTVQILFDDKPTWVVYSDMKNMMGDEADQRIRDYYRDRNLECPWDIKPKRRLKVIEDDEDTELEAADIRSPRQATKAVPKVNSTKQMDLVIAQLQTLTIQMNEMQKLNMQLMQGMLQSQGPVIKQENQGEVEQL